VEILIYSIEKVKDGFTDDIDRYIKMSKNYASIKEYNFFNNKIAKAQSKSKEESLRAYDEIYESKIDGFSVGLDERGEMLDSLEFADLIAGKNKVSFFIGGPYGLSNDFKNKVDRVISLSRLTFAHKIAKLVLYEQIFRALTINANHPYHK